MSRTSLDLRREDFPDLTGPRIERLLKALNAFGGGVSPLLDRGLTFKANLRCFVKDLTFTTHDDWQTLSLTAPYTAGSPTPSWRKRGRRVEFRGLLTLNAATTGSTWATVPANAYPGTFSAFAVPGGAAGEFLRASVSTAGAGTLVWSGAPTTCSIDALAYDAADETGGVNGVFPVTFKNELGVTPSHVFVTRAVTVSGGVESPAPVGGVAWATAKDQIVIRDVGDVLHSRTYRLRLICVAE